jgi:hypothetical protein
MLRECCECAFHKAIRCGLLRELAEIASAVIGLDSGEPGEGYASGVEVAACHNGLHFRDVAVVEADEDIDVAGIRVLRGVGYAVIGTLESIFTAASIVRR